ncbi:hypothetical protein M3Y95_00184900 [Aphelenchoides besseyi]|nr:hypothetical protein M3Y95_00184900 [Aphelenchoides besseyi]
MTTPLIDALENEDYEEAITLVAKDPALIVGRDASGRIALHYAAETANANVFRTLLDADSSLIDAQDSNGFTPLFVAVTANNVEVVRLLIERGTQLDQVDFDKHTAVHWAVVCGQLEALEELLHAKTSISTPDTHGAFPLHYAVTIDDVAADRVEAILNALLKSGTDVNCRDADDRTPLLWAASCGNTSAVQRLIEAGANKNAVDRDYLNALHCAANHGYDETIRLLLKRCNQKLADGKDKNGDTPLFYAATFGHYECARLLLENANADPNHVDKRLRTAAHCAAAKGQMRTLKLLRQYGASFDMANYRGDLPFHEAVQTGNIEVVQWLLALSPSNISVGNFYGRTVLHLAAANGDFELVKLLCERGAPVNALMIYHNQLCTALDLARQRRHQPIIDYLQDYPRNAQSANDMDDQELKKARADIEDNVRLDKVIVTAKLRWTQVRDANEVVDEEIEEAEWTESGRSTRGLQRGSSFAHSKRDRPLKLERRSSSVNGELRLPPIQTNSTGMINREAQTDEAHSQRIGREMVEEAIRQVVGEDSLRVLRASIVKTHNSNRLPSVHQKTNGNARSPTTDDDYPTQPASESELNESPMRTVQRRQLSNRSNGTKKRVTVNGGTRIREFEYERDKSDVDDYADDELAALPNKNGRRFISEVLQTPQQGTSERFVHEKAIFQELTHLKRVQLQYGRVQEKILVRSLINNFCKMHGLNPSNFRYTTFYSWEKFLYDMLSDQLKLIYLEERDRIQTHSVNAAPRPTAVQFERRLRKVSPLNDRIRELTRIYNSAAKKRAPVSSGERRSRLRSRPSVDRSIRDPASAHDKRCNCLKTHTHLLLNND